jgi:hypothetical protein
MADGWEVMASMVVDAGDGRGPALQLLLRPPRSRQEGTPLVSAGSAGNTAVPAWAWAIAGLVSGAGMAFAKWGAW